MITDGRQTGAATVAARGAGATTMRLAYPTLLRGEPCDDVQPASPAAHRRPAPGAAGRPAPARLRPAAPAGAGHAAAARLRPAAAVGPPHGYAQQPAARVRPAASAAGLRAAARATGQPPQQQYGQNPYGQPHGAGSGVSFDAKKLTMASYVIAGGTLLYLILSFLHLVRPRSR